MTCLMHLHARAHAHPHPASHYFTHFHFIWSSALFFICVLKKGQWRSSFFFPWLHNEYLHGIQTQGTALKQHLQQLSGDWQRTALFRVQTPKESYRSILFNMTKHSKVPPKYPSVHIHNFHCYTHCSRHIISFSSIVLFSLVGTIWLGIYPFLTFYLTCWLLFQ